MNPDLISAIKERIQVGHSQERIYTELKDAGYAQDAIEEAYAQAMTESVTSSDTADAPVVQSGTAILPSATTLFSNGWKFVTSRLDLLGLVAIPYIVFGIASVFIESSQEINGGLLVVALIAFIAILVNTAAMLFVVTESTKRRVAYTEALRWAQNNIVNVVWISILTTLVVLGGYVLFIIPGIILSIYLYLSMYAFSFEGQKGMKALLRSRDLIVGSWWLLFRRLFLLGIFAIVTVFVITFVVSFVTGLVAGESTVAAAVTEAISAIAQVFVTLLFLHVGMECFKVLSAVRPLILGEEQTGRGKYVALAWLGLLSPIVFMIGLIALAGITLFSTTLGLDQSYEFHDDAKERASELREMEIEPMDNDF